MRTLGPLVFAAALMLPACHTPHAPASAPRAPTSAPSTRCALIVTDDDIPSGSATAGALYVGEDLLGRRLLTADVLAVAAGFREAGLCVVVADSHDGAIDGARLAASEIPLLTPSDRARWTVPLIGTHGPRYVAAALVGFHARAGRQGGFRPHTVNDHVRAARIGDRPLGEVGALMIALSGLRLPVVLVSGDHAAAEEARAFAPGVEAVAVRWRRPDGGAGFLSEAEAPRVLREAARRAARRAAPRLAIVFPVVLTVEAHSAPRAEAVVRQLGEERGELSTLLRALGHAAFEPAPERRGAELRWTAPDAAAAGFSFYQVASACMSRATRQAWDWVTKGSAALEAGQREAALAAFQRAIEAEPAEPAHRCRLARALLAMGRDEAARAAYGEAVGRLDEIVDPAMKAVCLAGLAAMLVAREPAAAAALYRRILTLPDHRGSRERARRAITRLGGRDS